MNYPIPATKTIHAGIVGASGYAGGELIRLLLEHPNVALDFVHSRHHEGKPVAELHPDLTGETSLNFCAKILPGVDLIFLCLGPGESRKFLDEQDIPESIKIIDLSADFRQSAVSTGPDRHFVYGLPEWNREAIQVADHIANPGCFATAIQLALLPLAANGLLQEAHITGITGSTGAGQSLSATTHFSWRSGNIQAYKTLNHQHVAEVQHSLGQAAQGRIPGIHFVPWRGDFTRGIFISSIVDCSLSGKEASALYRSFYAQARFTHFSDTAIDLKRVLNTNKCLISLEKSGGKLAIHAALDNLLKGAAGQAVQNMNLLFGCAEDAGLRLKASAF